MMNEGNAQWSQMFYDVAFNFPFTSSLFFFILDSEGLYGKIPLGNIHIHMQRILKELSDIWHLIFG